MSEPKVPALHDLAPTQTEPPFGITQLVVLAMFVVLVLRAMRKARTAPASARPAVQADSRPPAPRVAIRRSPST